ncbi:MAG: hypothetical protein K0S65_79 [Labilithrix sp.]|nr:hypothetical protein [Labilithrix sp.]
MKLMTEAPSADTSLAYDGSSVRGARRRGGTAKPAVSELLRLIHRLALAIVTIVVCAVIASPGRGSVSLLAGALDVTAADCANAGRGVLTSEPLQYCQGDHGERGTDLKAVEFDGDDEDDPLWHVAENAALSFRRVPAPPKPNQVLRGELQIDTSRFAAGTGLPRGPPV